MRKFLMIGLLAVLAGCQTTYTYVPIIPNPKQIDMAQAQCQMMSGSVQQGMVAWGNANYVAGAQLGNAIGNAIRVDQFMQQCMTLQGWKRTSQGETQAVRRELAKPHKGPGAFPAKPK
jgi:hypothetical protein